MLALLQNGLKRLLAYSSVAHLGYLLIAVAASSSVSHTGTLVDPQLVKLVAQGAEVACHACIQISSSNRFLGGQLAAQGARVHRLLRAGTWPRTGATVP